MRCLSCRLNQSGIRFSPRYRLFLPCPPHLSPPEKDRAWVCSAAAVHAISGPWLILTQGKSGHCAGGQPGSGCRGSPILVDEIRPIASAGPVDTQVAICKA